MKLTTLNITERLNTEELVFISGGTAVTSKKNDTRHDSDRSDGSGCTPPHN